MAREEIYITDIADVGFEGECVRAEFRSGRKSFVLRGTVHTSIKAIELFRLAMERRKSAEVVPLPHS